MLEFWTLKNIKKAKKNHKCDLCELEIHTGEPYTRYSGKYDGEIFDNCYCKVCYEILNRFMYDSDDSEYDNDWVIDYAWEYICEEICGAKGKDDCTVNGCLRCEKLREHILSEMNKEK